MKKLFFFVLIFLTSHMLNAHTTLSKKNPSEIEVKIPNVAKKTLKIASGAALCSFGAGTTFVKANNQLRIKYATTIPTELAHKFANWFSALPETHIPMRASSLTPDEFRLGIKTASCALASALLSKPIAAGSVIAGTYILYRTLALNSKKQAAIDKIS